jgi:hypothetical protein
VSYTKNFLAPCHLADVRKICSSSNIRSYTANMRHMSTKFMPLATPRSAVSFIVSLYGLSIYGSTALVDVGCYFSFLMYTQSVGFLGRGISPSQGRSLHTKQHTQNKRTQTSMPWVGFEPTIPVFERAKTFHALDRASTVNGRFMVNIGKYGFVFNWLSTTPRRHIGEWRYSSIILYLGTRSRRMVSFTTRPLYPRGKSRSRAGLDTGEKEDLLPLSGIEPRPSSV